MFACICREETTSSRAHLLGRCGGGGADGRGSVGRGRRIGRERDVSDGAQREAECEMDVVEELREERAVGDELGVVERLRLEHRVQVRELGLLRGVHQSYRAEVFRVS